MSFGKPGDHPKPLRVSKATEFADEKNLGKFAHCPLGKLNDNSRHSSNQKGQEAIQS